VTVLDSPAKNDTSGAARRAMIDSQLRTSGVTAAAVVARMAAVPREDFVPASARAAAYMDRAVPLGDGKYLAAPLVHGMLLQEADPASGDNCIVVDGGSGYLPELLRPLVGSLTVLTPEQALAKGSETADLILIDGAIEQMPDTLASRLVDGGRLVTGLIENGVTSVARGRKSGTGVAFMKLGEVGVPRLAAFDKPKGWSF
jgi:protein-L-isoaspartate(D-aspartate) O-methyltransferase